MFSKWSLYKVIGGFILSSIVIVLTSFLNLGKRLFDLYRLPFDKEDCNCYYVSIEVIYAELLFLRNSYIPLLEPLISGNFTTAFGDVIIFLLNFYPFKPLVKP